MTEANSHFVKIVLFDGRPAFRLLRYFLLAALPLMGLLGLRFAFLSLAPPGVYMKDFIQEYLLAQAAVHGVNPYLPLPELADRFIGPLENPIFPHPTPHPPPVILLSLPLILFSYETAALIWLLFEILCITGSAYLLGRWWKSALPLWVVIPLTLVILGWGPVTDNLVVGQLTSLLLLLLCAAWILLRDGRWNLGSLFLGVAVGLKLVIWPLALLLIFYRRWSAFLILVSAFIALNALAGLIVGLDTVVYYYTTVSAEVEPIYRTHEENFALWGLGWRLFAGTGSNVLGGIHAPPLLYLPEIGMYASLLIISLFLALTLFICLTVNDLDVRLATLICAAVVVNPIAWSHYLVLLLIPLTVAGRYLFDLKFPRTPTNWGLIILLLMLWPRSELRRLVRLFAVNDTGLDIFPAVPFAASLLTLAPLAAVIGLMLFLWRLKVAEMGAEVHDPA